MSDLLPFLKTLLAAPGLSGREDPVARLVAAKWEPLVDEVRRAGLDSVQALKRGTGKGSRRRVMLAAHMDAIGMIVSAVRDGFLSLAGVGGVDPRVLPGTPVLVHASGGGKTRALPGVIAQPPAKALPPPAGDGAVPLDRLLVDIGLRPRQVAQRVRVGDLVSFDTVPVELAGDAIAGHSLDNRASVAAVTVALEELQGRGHSWDVWAVATSQEEITYGGSSTSAFGLQPDLAVVLDVTYGKGPGTGDWSAFPIGKGPTIGFGPNLHPFLFERLKSLAEELEIPYSMEVMPGHSGTDAYATQASRAGIPTALIEIPLRYMHTPVELVAVRDIQRAGRLLAEFVAGLTPDFIDGIRWD